MNSLRRSTTSSAGTGAGTGSATAGTSAFVVISVAWDIGLLLLVGEYENWRARRIPSRARGRGYGYSAEEHAAADPSKTCGRTQIFRSLHSFVTPGSDPGGRRTPCPSLFVAGVRPLRHFGRGRMVQRISHVCARRFCSVRRGG